MEALLKALGPVPAGKVGDAALRAAAKPIIAEARRLVPKKTKELMRSIMAAPNTRKRSVSERAYYVGFRRPTSRRAHLTEFGFVHTSGKHVPPQPFMRPALDISAAEVFRIIGNAIALGIAKEAARLRKTPGRNR
jgi:HK97 gp10 family phage protein